MFSWEDNLSKENKRLSELLIESIISVFLVNNLLKHIMKFLADANQKLNAEHHHLWQLLKAIAYINNDIDNFFHQLR